MLRRRWGHILPIPRIRSSQISGRPRSRGLAGQSTPVIRPITGGFLAVARLRANSGFPDPHAAAQLLTIRPFLGGGAPCRHLPHLQRSKKLYRMPKRRRLTTSSDETPSVHAVPSRHSYALQEARLGLTRSLALPCLVTAVPQSASRAALIHAPHLKPRIPGTTQIQVKLKLDKPRGVGLLRPPPAHLRGGRRGRPGLLRARRHVALSALHAEAGARNHHRLAGRRTQGCFIPPRGIAAGRASWCSSWRKPVRSSGAELTSPGRGLRSRRGSAAGIAVCRARDAIAGRPPRRRTA